MNVSMIMGLGPKNELGVGKELCYDNMVDMKWFKFITIGNIVVMGYRTWESLGMKPLPNRLNIVLKYIEDKPVIDELQVRDTCFLYILKTERADKIIERIKTLFHWKKQDIFIIGGAYTYKLFEDIADQLYITRFNKECSRANVFYEPKLDRYKLVKYPIEFFKDEEVKDIEGIYKYY